MLKQMDTVGINFSTYLDYYRPFRRRFLQHRLQRGNPKGRHRPKLENLRRHQEVFRGYQALLLHMVCTLNHL